jgi:drug/metabolite transporter (DMT)-like permease
MFHATKQMSEAIQSSNYLYLNPLFTTIAASLILEEQLTVFAVAGVGLVLGGVYFAARKS